MHYPVSIVKVCITQTLSDNVLNVSPVGDLVGNSDCPLQQSAAGWKSARSRNPFSLSLFIIIIITFLLWLADVSLVL